MAQPGGLGDAQRDPEAAVGQVLDALDGRLPSETPRDTLFERLDTFRAAADARVEKLRERLMMAEEFAQRLRDEAAGRTDGGSPAPEPPRAGALCVPLRGAAPVLGLRPVE